MGLSDNGGGWDHHPTTHFQYFEDLRIPRLGIHLPGFKKRIDIWINKIESLNDEYVSGVETYLLLGGKSIHRTFYDVHSSGAKEILQKYKPEFAWNIYAYGMLYLFKNYEILPAYIGLC